MYANRYAATRLAWSPDGATLYVSYGASRLFNADPNVIAKATIPGTVLAWDPTTGELLHQFAGHTDAVEGLALSADGTRLYSAEEDDLIIVWDVSGLR